MGKGITSSLLTLAGLPLLLALAACQPNSGAPTTTALAERLPVVATAAAQRMGDWQGGPLPVSAKIPSGVSTWWRLAPPDASGRIQVTLRWEDATAADARVQLRGGDGAVLLTPQVEGRWWSLPERMPSTMTVELQAPAGTSYLLVDTAQGGRHSVQAIALTRAGSNPSEASRARADYAQDGRGEAIVRMQAASAGR